MKKMSDIQYLSKIIDQLELQLNEKDKEIERLNKIIEELEAILKSKGYETYIPVLERSDKE